MAKKKELPEPKKAEPAATSPVAVPPRTSSGQFAPRVVKVNRNQSKSNEELVKEYEFDKDEPAVEQEPVAEVAPVVETKGPKHPAGIVQLAKDWDLPDEEIEQASTAELLSYVRGRQQAAREFVRSGTNPNLNSEQRTSPGTESTKVQDAPATPDELDEVVKSAEESLTDEHAALFRKVVSHVRKVEAKYKALEASQNELRQFEARRQEETNSQFFDRLFADAKRSDIFGDGAGRDVTPKQFETRKDILKIAIGGDPNVPVQKRFADVIERLFPAAAAPKTEDAAPKVTNRLTATKGDINERLRQREEEWSDATLARPGAREVPLTPEQRAKRKIQQHLNAMNDEAIANGEAHEVFTG